MDTFTCINYLNFKYKLQLIIFSLLFQNRRYWNLICFYILEFLQLAWTIVVWTEAALIFWVFVLLFWYDNEYFTVVVVELDSVVDKIKYNQSEAVPVCPHWLVLVKISLSNEDIQTLCLDVFLEYLKSLGDEVANVASVTQCWLELILVYLYPTDLPLIQVP